MFETTLRRLFGAQPQPDGVATGVEQDALAAGAHLVAAAPVPPGRDRPETIIATALGQKILHSWLQNRHQTRFPLVLNLRNNKPAEVLLILQAVRRSLLLVDAEPAALQNAAAFIESIGGTLTTVEHDNDPALVKSLHEARLTSEAYAACAGALGRRTIAGRRYLEFLAARLGIPDEVARSLNRRFGS